MNKTTVKSVYALSLLMIANACSAGDESFGSGDEDLQGNPESAGSYASAVKACTADFARGGGVGTGGDVVARNRTFNACLVEANDAVMKQADDRLGLEESATLELALKYTRQNNCFQISQAKSGFDSTYEVAIATEAVCRAHRENAVARLTRAHLTLDESRGPRPDSGWLTQGCSDSVGTCADNYSLASGPSSAGSANTKAAFGFDTLCERIALANGAQDSSACEQDARVMLAEFVRDTYDSQ